MIARHASILLIAIFTFESFAQTAQVGGDRNAQSRDDLRIDYVHYRPAEWETERVEEFENEPANEGGLLYLYFTNTSDEVVDLRYWRINGEDESYWRLNHFVAWDRNYRHRLAPGEQGVLEINGITDDFGPGQPFSFSWVGSSWRPVVRFKSDALKRDPVEISVIRVLPGMKEIVAHVRFSADSDTQLLGMEVVGQTIVSENWLGNEPNAYGHGIVRLTLENPLRPSQLTVLKLRVLEGDAERGVYAHRRAFEDYFPIGTWNSDDQNLETLHSIHVDTFVRGGGKTDPFRTEVAPKYGFRTMVHTGLPVNVDIVRELGDDPAMACWMLQDEPDWSIPSNIMLFADDTVRKFNSTVPTFITLCRNIKFFEYGPIADIPCMDHYAVTAPSSSKWPKPYGTRLEETGYYTRDLKRAAEPKPIWIWTQGIADWGQRPKRPVPTPDELAAQLVLNLGEGAKGILWFNYGREIAEKFPDAVEAMQGWGRVMKVLRDDILASEPVALDIEAPEKVIVMPLVTRDKVILCITNADYEIHPEAYPFVEKEDVEISLPLPPWVTPATTLEVSPDGFAPVPVSQEDGRATLTLERLGACTIVVLAHERSAAETFQQRLDAALAVE